MKKDEKKLFSSRKGTSTAILCFAAVMVMVGAYAFGNYRTKLNRQMARVQKEAREQARKDTKATTANDIVLPQAEKESEAEQTTDNALPNNTTDDTDPGSDSESAGNATKAKTGNGGSAQPNTAPETKPADPATRSTASHAEELWFDTNSILQWPASGVVLLGYSMDQTVYFPTLDQYRCHPALLIGGQPGEPIGAAAPGTVADIVQNPKMGLTVTVDMGNGYHAVYGQLKDVPLEKGAYVGTGEAVGYLNEPTKYYAKEGPHLYFQLLKDGAPVNPLDFVES